MLGFRAPSRSRALALSRSRARLLAVVLELGGKAGAFRPGHSKEAAFLLLPLSHIPHLVAPLPFPPLSRVEPPQTTTRRDDTSLSLVRAHSSLPLFFVRNGKAGAFSTPLVQRLDGRRLPIVARECDLCGATKQHCIIFNGTMYA